VTGWRISATCQARREGGHYGLESAAKRSFERGCEQGLLGRDAARLEVFLTGRHDVLVREGGSASHGRTSSPLTGHLMPDWGPGEPVAEGVAARKGAGY